MAADEAYIVMWRKYISGKERKGGKKISSKEMGEMGFPYYNLLTSQESKSWAYRLRPANDLNWLLSKG